MNWSRRSFLRTGALSLLGSGLSGWVGSGTLARVSAQPPAKPTGPADGPLRAIDAHTHFYNPDRPQGVPWPGKGDKLLYRAVLPPEFKQLTKPHHVQGTIVVEASPWLEDNQWLLDLAAKEPFIVGVVGRLDPGTDDFPKHLGRFARDSLFRGIRINHDALRRGLSQKKFIDHLGLLVERDLVLDVNGGPDMPADVATLAHKLPKLRIIINHAANLPIDGKPVPPAWLKGMREAAAGKNVFCKVSALVEGASKKDGDVPTAIDFYRPVLDALWQTFGEDRLIYASNWPVSNKAAPYATVYEIPRKYLEKRGPGATEKFFLRNAIAAYKPVIREPKGRHE
jgi:predicted TIM-barrel fold metal-dependent hydrolase